MSRNLLDHLYSSLFPKYQRHGHSTDKAFMDLFDNNLSNQNIPNIINLLYNTNYSK